MHTTKIIAAVVGILCIASAQAAPDATTEADPCAQIRTEIAAKTGLLERPDTTLLEKLGTHPECRFTSAEAYRAAYGDKPIPKYQRSERRHRHHNDDDDD